MLPNSILRTQNTKQFLVIYEGAGIKKFNRGGTQWCSRGMGVNVIPPLRTPITREIPEVKFPCMRSNFFLIKIPCDFSLHFGFEILNFCLWDFFCWFSDRSPFPVRTYGIVFPGSLATPLKGDGVHGKPLDPAEAGFGAIRENFRFRSFGAIHENG